MSSKDKKIETNIITTEKVNQIMEKEKHALPLKLHERLWFRGKDNFGIRKQGIKFASTQEEIEEYIKCKLSVYYFAEKYCKIKLEDGSVGQMKLRDYQKDIIKLYTENRFSILMASRQVGKCIDFNTRILCKDELTENTFYISIGRLYYDILSEKRKLNIYEKIKLFLYKILEKI